MTNHLAAIREAANSITESICWGTERYHAWKILRRLDEAEKDSPCRVVETDYQYDECSKRKSALYPGDFCPGCGRRIERGSEEA